ncbi:MAG TPA: hypothetical protein VGN95_11810 [Pyrinomonadaceae bacterium]|nr:hypothetical protein [Pyrinomonadaceae bacterium]
MLILFLGKHLIWSRPNGSGGTNYYYYDDEITWIVGALALSWLTWFFVRRYRRTRALRRPQRRTDYRLLKRIVKIKRELSSPYLRPGFSMNIHAIGIGILGGNQYCIQVFVNDANEEIWAGSAGATLPDSYRGVPLVLIEMPVSVFLSDVGLSSFAAWDQYPNGIREHQEVIIGGISGANTNLTGQSGTIGYFCTRRSNLPRRKEIHLLSNSHVFADLRKAKVDDGDLIMQPSPGEPANNRPIGTLVNFCALKFDADIKEPNHIDAAIARLWGPHQHKPVIPLIGAVKGYVAKKDIGIGEVARKFGRTTGYTEGSIFSIYLDIWIRYDRTGQSAFFQNQFLIEPSLPKFTKFVSKGDSGSLVVDAQQYAIGLIFAGMSEVPESLKALPNIGATVGIDPATNKPKRIESYGVANPISEVLDRLKIELLV